MRTYPGYGQIHSIIQNLLTSATPLTGVLYRFVAPQWGGPTNLISGEGSYNYGGRWNWPVLSRAVYGSFEPEAALAEANSHAQRLGVTLAHNLPRSMEAFRVELSEVLGLTDVTLQPQLGLPADLLSVPWERAIAEDWEAVTHAVGRAAFEEGFEGIIVPCAPKPEMKNLVVFRENLRPDSTITYY